MSLRVKRSNLYCSKARDCHGPSGLAMTTPQIICDRVLVPVAETVFVIPAEAGIQFFALDPCFRRGDIVDFRFPQQILTNLTTQIQITQTSTAEASKPLPKQSPYILVCNPFIRPYGFSSSPSQVLKKFLHISRS